MPPAEPGPRSSRIKYDELPSPYSASEDKGAVCMRGQNVKSEQDRGRNSRRGAQQPRERRAVEGRMDGWKEERKGGRKEGRKERRTDEKKTQE
eukprot:30033-Rhodomonas_salina.3